MKTTLAFIALTGALLGGCAIVPAEPAPVVYAAPVAPPAVVVRPYVYGGYYYRGGPYWRRWR
jgi:hypothetical protein